MLFIHYLLDGAIFEWLEIDFDPEDSQILIFTTRKKKQKMDAHYEKNLTAKSF